MCLHSTFFFALLCSSLSALAQSSGPQPAGATPAIADGAQASTPAQLSILWRSYAEQIEEGKDARHAWVQSVRFIADSAFTAGPIGVGVDLGLYSAWKLNASPAAGNMVYVKREGGGQSRDLWAYPGLLAVKARHGDWVAKYGLHTVANPVLAPFDNKSLPPSFRGLSLTGKVDAELSVELGSFNGMIRRSHSDLTRLSSAYGWIPYPRLSYVGFRQKGANENELAVYAGHANDMWNQLYVGMGTTVKIDDALSYRARFDFYGVDSVVGGRQGPMSTAGFSVSHGVRFRQSSLTLSYQQIVGEQWVDFCRDSQGFYLANSVANDFNAPNERSLQLRYAYRGLELGAARLNVSAWAVAGWRADASVEAARQAALGSLLHNLYWKNGAPIRGPHQELGIKATVMFPGGFLKDTTAALSLISHQVSAHYLGESYRQIVLTLNRPISAS